MMFPHQFLQVSRVFSTSTVTGFRRGGLYELQKSAPDLCQLYPRGRRNLEGNMEHQDVYTIACRTASSERGKTGKNPPLAGAPDVSSGPPFSLMLYKEHGPIQSHSMKKNTHTHTHCNLARIVHVSPSQISTICPCIFEVTSPASVCHPLAILGQKPAKIIC